MTGNSDIEALLPRYFSGEATDEERMRVVQWVRESDEHARIARQIQQLCLAADALDVLERVDTERALKQVNARIDRARFRRLVRWTERVAAVLFLPLLALSLFLINNPEEPRMLEVRTNPGMTTRLTLPDGTQVCLNSESALIYPEKFEGKTRAVKLAGGFGLRFDSAALDLFVHRVNESTRQIANELTKLDVYLGPERRQVTEQDVDLMVAVSRTGVVFEISRALENNDCRQAVRLVNEQLNRGEQAVAIMRAAIVPTVRNRFIARLLMDTYQLRADNYRSFESAVKALPAEAKRLFPVKKDGTPNVYGCFNAARTCGKLKLAKARRDLQACAAADRALVSTGLDARDILHKLIATLTA